MGYFKSRDRPTNLDRREKEVQSLKMALLSLLTVCCLMLAVAPAMADTYSNGPFNGTNDGWTINFGFTVSDSFTLK